MLAKRICGIFLSIVMIASIDIAPLKVSASNEFDREKYYQDTINEFSQYDYSDQQFVPDEEFFGTWEDGEWVKGPYFNYASYPDLAAVENAAKEGDYTLCKEEILKYYRNRYKSYSITVNAPKNVTDRALARYEAAFDNFFPINNMTISGRIVFGKEYGWSAMTVTEDVKKYTTEANKRYLLQLAAAKRDGYRVSIKTKESGEEYVPYIRALINNQYYENFYAVSDTYVSGMEKNKSFGNEDVMRVEESVSTINTSSNSDEYTKVGFLQFDFSRLTANDTITEATLYLYGKMEESDCPAGIRVQAETKSLYALPFTHVVALDESGFNYTEYKSYKGSYMAYDGKEISTSSGYGVQITFFLDQVRRGYIATGNEAFAFHTIRILLGLINKNGSLQDCIDRDIAMKAGPADADIAMPFYFSQKGYELPEYLYGIIQSEHMTPDAMTSILKHIWLTGQFIVERWSASEENNNFGTYSIRGLTTLAMFYPEFVDATKPITHVRDESIPGSMLGGWIPVSEFRRDHKMKTDFKEDGASNERSMEYATENLENILQPVSVASKVGVDARDYFSEYSIDKMKTNVMFLLGNLNPWFGDWQYGDSASHNDNFASRLSLLSKLVDIPYITYANTKGAKGTKPPFLTTVNDTANNATFRNSWNSDAVAGHLENAGGYGSHGHNDDLSLTLAAYGNYLLVDPLMGYYNINEDLKERWASSTRGHNTVEINDTVGAGGRWYLAYEENPKYFKSDEPDYFGDAMKVPIRQLGYKKGSLYPQNREINNVYDYIRGETFAYENNNAMEDNFKVLRDILFLRSGYFIVTDYLEPQDKTKENKYKQMWHFLPDAGIELNQNNNVFKTHFDNKANLIVATVDPDGILNPYIKDGLYASSKNNFTDAKYGVYEKKATGTVTFNTLLYPTPIGKSVSVNTTPIDINGLDSSEANAFTATIDDVDSGKNKTVSFYTLFDESKKRNIKFGDFETDGVLSLVDKEDDLYSETLIRKGSTIKDVEQDRYLVYSSDEIGDLGVRWEGSKIDLATSKVEGEEAVDFSKMTIYAGEKIDTVLLNGEEISFSQQGKYVYFGQNTIIPDDTQIDEPETGDTNDSSQNVHGAGNSQGAGSSSGGGAGGGAGAGTDSKEDNIENVNPDAQKNPVDAFRRELLGHWAEKEISSLINTGIVSGNGEGNLELNKTVTRAEAVTMIVRALKLEKCSYSEKFSDVEKDDWYSGYIGAAIENNLISGDGVNMYPNREITREELAKIISIAWDNLYKNQGYGKEITFPDQDNISPWALDYVKKASAYGIINGMETGEFKPKDSAKRSEAMVMIYRLLNNQNK